MINNKGVKFGNYHSYTNWNLILVEGSVEFPQAKTETVNVPGMDGVIDLTGVLSSDVKYENRALSFEFAWKGSYDDREGFLNKISEIASALHGQKLQIILDDDPDYYYTGRCHINDMKTNFQTMTFTIDCDCEPYKYIIESSGNDWLWNPFSFVDGVIQLESFSISGTESRAFPCERKTVSPTIKWQPDTAGDTLTITQGETTVTISSGSQIVYDIRFKEGSNTLTFTGEGTVTVRYQRGTL